MDITQTLTGDLMHVAVAGRLDSYWADHLSDTLGKVVRQGHHRIRLDCSQVNFLSSSGIRVLLQFHKQLKSISGSFLVVSPSRPVLEVLEVTCLVADARRRGRTGRDASRVWTQSSPCRP